MVEYTVTCATLGHNQEFSVKIDSNELVSELKNKIRATEFQTLASASALQLYKVDIPLSESDPSALFHSISQHTIEFDKGKELRNPFCKLSKIKGGFPDGVLHILVQLPPSESIHSRACGAVADTHPPNRNYRPNDSLYTRRSRNRLHCVLPYCPILHSLYQQRRCTLFADTPPPN